jgi:hypothetical protein
MTAIKAPFGRRVELASFSEQISGTFIHLLLWNSLHCFLRGSTCDLSKVIRSFCGSSGRFTRLYSVVYNARKQLILCRPFLNNRDVLERRFRRQKRTTLRVKHKEP